MKQFVVLVVLAASAMAQADRCGRPACSGHDQEFADRTFFQLCFDGSRKVSIWVGYEPKPEPWTGSAPRPSHFRADRELSSVSAVDDVEAQTGLDFFAALDDAEEDKLESSRATVLVTANR